MMVAEHLISKALRSIFVTCFPDPNSFKKKKNTEASPYTSIVEWFSQGHRLETELELSDAQYTERLHSVPGLSDLVQKLLPGLNKQEITVWMEFLLHGMAEYSLLRRDKIKSGGLSFTDILNNMFSDFNEEDEA
jgi:magnesium chelatase subunit I